VLKNTLKVEAKVNWKTKMMVLFNLTLNLISVIYYVVLQDQIAILTSWLTESHKKIRFTKESHFKHTLMVWNWINAVAAKHNNSELWLGSDITFFCWGILFSDSFSVSHTLISHYCTLLNMFYHDVCIFSPYQTSNRSRFDRFSGNFAWKCVFGIHDDPFCFCYWWD